MCGEFMYRIAIASLWASSILYGLYAALFAASVYVLVKRRPNTPFLATSVALFTLTTALSLVYFLKVLLTPVVTSLSTLERGRIVPCGGAPAAAHETATGYLLLVVGHACTAAMFVIADGFLIIRCAILWDAKRWVVAFPSVLLLASTACNLARIHYDSVLADPGAPSAPAATMAARFANAGTSLSLATNVVTSFLIAFRIWRMTRDIEKVLGKKAGMRYRSIIAMTVESGALFSVSLVAELAVSFSPVPVVLTPSPSHLKRKACYTVALETTVDISDMIVGYVMAICPTLIIVRVGMGRGFDTVQDSVHQGSAPYAAAGVGTTSTLSAMQFRSVQESDVAESESDAVCEVEKARRGGMV